MRITLKDNHGIWTDMIKRRVGAEFIVRTHFLPDPALSRAFGQELVYSVRGTKKHKFVFSRQNGRLVWNRFSNGTYPFGIAKRMTPDGVPYEPLENSTLRHRKYKGIKRGENFILRETGTKIFNGIHVKDVKVGRLRATSTVGWEGEGAELVNMFMKGFSPIDTDWYDRPAPQGFAAITVAPRPVKGIQQEYKNVISEAMASFLGAR